MSNGDQISSEMNDNISRNDSSSPPKHLVLGYPILGSYMGASPETAILRRFADLNMQTLLYYQAELICLQARLRDLELANSRCNASDPKSRMSKDWEWLSRVDPNGHPNEQMRLALQIRGVLKEYS